MVKLGNGGPALVMQNADQRRSWELLGSQDVSEGRRSKRGRGMSSANMHNQRRSVKSRAPTGTGCLLEDFHFPTGPPLHSFLVFSALPDGGISRLAAIALISSLRTWQPRKRGDQCGCIGPQACRVTEQKTPSRTFLSKPRGPAPTPLCTFRYDLQLLEGNEPLHGSF